MSQNFIPIKPSAPRKMPQKQFKLPIQQSMQIIDEVRKIQKYTKTIRPDENRKQYQNLLQWVSTSLQSTKRVIQMQAASYTSESEQCLQEQTVDQQVQVQQQRIIQTLMLQLRQIFKRQCKQKSQLMQIIFDYFTQLINMYSKHYEKQYIDTLHNYNIELKELQGDYEIKLNECNKRISYLESQKETKWKNVYMLAKDNRILRRQKGKLLRTVQEQDEKIKLLESQLCQAIKENETNKLVIRFESNSENLKVFMKNRLALMKFQKIIDRFPKKAMKVLNNDLLKLEIEQLNSLDSKIDYIRRVITQNGDMFDEYQDLNQLVARHNKMVFNASCQTDPEDIEPPKEFRDFGTSYDMELRLRRFDTWQQIYDIKLKGWTEMKQKFVYFKSPNKKNPIQTSMGRKKFQTNQPKGFFLLQISSGEVDQCINGRARQKSEGFNKILTTGITFNPKLKNKTKLYFVMPYQNRIMLEDPDDDIDAIFKKTLPIGTKKQKEAFIRKSQMLNQNSSEKNRLKIIKSSQKKRNSEAITLEREFSQNGSDSRAHEESPTIQELSQTDSEINTQQQADRIEQFNQLQGSEPHQMHPRFRNKRRSVKKSLELLPQRIQCNSTQKISIFKQQTLNQSSSRQSVNIHHPSSLLKSKKQRISTQVSMSQQNSKRKPVALNKINRIKTSQNARTSKISNENPKNRMDQIFQEPDQNNDNDKTLFNLKNNKSSRISYMPTPKSLQRSKFSQTMGNLTNLNNLSNVNSNQNCMNELEGILAQRNQRYHLRINPANPSTMARKISKFVMRNSSYNTIKFKQRESANIDTQSINSDVSSQQPSSFNYKLYINEMQVKRNNEILQSEAVNRVSIKNFEVKKLAQKIIRSMYSRRKELLLSQGTSLRVFVQNFLKQIYGNNWKGEKNLLRHAFTIEDRECSASIKTLSLMLNTNVQVEYLEDLFRLYVTMLLKNEFSSSENPMITSKTQGAGILKYLLSVYFDQATAGEIQQNLPFMNQFEIDLNEIFIVVETQIRKYTVETQVYGFLAKLLPENQSYIEFSQMKEILNFIRNDDNYHAHIARMKYFFKTYGKIVAQQQQAIVTKTENAKTVRASKTADRFLPQQKSRDTLKQDSKTDTQILPIHRVCLYLKRYQWTDMLDINNHIQQRYHKLVGVFIQQESIKFITRYCAHLDQTPLKKKAFYHSGSISMDILVSQQPASSQQPTHPLAWLLNRSKELIRNYYRYKGPLDRHLLMFVHLSILTYELDLKLNQVLSQTMSFINLEYKKLKTKEEVDTFMRD